ncbi:MAG: trimethylamine methyltransferase family protein [Acidobacteria bacterium]|nr:trimethylamine methyltransferase family protein [Acidobacteriota bacterium]
MIPTIRPKLELLSETLIKKIIEEALIILEQRGVFVENRQALDLFCDSGMRVDSKTHRVYITPGLVEDSLDSAPETITLFDRTEEKAYIVGGDHVHFDPGSAAVHIFDPKTGRQRPAVSRDVQNFIRVTDALENIHFQSTGLMSSDVPDKIADSYRLFLALQYSSKPVVTGTFRVEGFKPMFDMLCAVRGSAQALADKPLAIFDACPSPPLKWSNLTTQSLIDSARAGIPSELISMGMTGATSPVTIAGTLVQHCVENFCGVIITQLAAKGSPVIFGGSPSSFDMRKGTTPMGAIETMMIDSGYAQIAKSLGLPTHAYMGLSDSKVNDNQAGFETGIGAVLAALSGINVISGPGMMDFESCQCLEKLVIDHEICTMAYRLIEGISQREDPIATSLFAELGDEMDFLRTEHTRKWFKQEHTYPLLIDRDTYDTWDSLGAKNIETRAAERVQEILGTVHRPDISLVKALRDIMTADAEASGITGLLFTE